MKICEKEIIYLLNYLENTLTKNNELNELNYSPIDDWYICYIYKPLTYFFNALCYHAFIIFLENKIHSFWLHELICASEFYVVIM